MSLQILLVEDDELFRLGLRIRLQQDPAFEIAAEAEDGETAIALAEQHALDLVLLDVGLPGIGGIEACMELKLRQPELPILALTSHDQPALITRLVEAGAQGYCLKGIAPDHLILAIRSVVAGASWWDATATQALRQTFMPTSETEAGLEKPKFAVALTHREQEILELLATGKSNPEIATQLYITPGTVRVHVHAILHKLGVRDRTQAVIVALQNQLIPDVR